MTSGFRAGPRAGVGQKRKCLLYQSQYGTYQVSIILKKILRSSGIKTESVSEIAKGYPPGLRLLYSSGFERQPSRFDGMHALDR
jgi:hypothetical protein